MAVVRRLLSAVVITLAVAAPAARAGTPAPALRTPWQHVSQLAYGVNIVALSCPSTRVCWAFSGQRLEYTDNGGATWTDRSALVPLQITGLSALDCPTVDACYVGGQQGDVQSIFRLSPGGAVVRDLATPAGSYLDSISCVSPTECVALVTVAWDSTSAYRTRDSGATWTQAGAVSGMHYALFCVPGSQWCVASGSNYEVYRGSLAVSDTGGRTWKRSALPAEVGFGDAVDCATVTDCIVGGDHGVELTHDGVHWTPSTVADDAFAVSCVDASVCEVGGNRPWRSTDGGATWVRGSYPTLPGLGLGRTAMSCLATTTCVLAVNTGEFLRTSDGGATWAVADAPWAYGETEDLACPTRQHCVALVSSYMATATALTTDDDGATWTPHPIPIRPAMATLAQLQCPTSTVCYARGGYGYPDSDLFKSVDGGSSWRVVRAPALLGLSCLSDSICVGINGSLWVTTDGGDSWQAYPAPPFARSSRAEGVVCGTLSNCILTRHVLNTTTLLAYTGDLGQTYSISKQTGYVTGLTCVDLTCYAPVYSPGVLKSTDGGQSWIRQSLPASFRPREISCSSAMACAIGGDLYDPGAPTQGLVLTTTTGGIRWTNQSTLRPPDSVLNVSCAPRLCMAIDDGGYVATGSP